MKATATCIVFVAAFAGTVRRIKSLHGPVAHAQSEMDEDSANDTTTLEENADPDSVSSFDFNNDTSMGAYALAELEDNMFRGVKASELVAKYQMTQHPNSDREWFTETFRSTMKFPTSRGERHASTVIYNLMYGGIMVTFRRLKSDEMRFYHFGRPMKIIEIVNGLAEETILGPNVAKGHVQHKVIKAGTWWGSCFLSSRNSGYYFGSNAVAPGFEFKDMEIGKRHELVKSYPAAKDWIMKLTAS